MLLFSEPADEPAKSGVGTMLARKLSQHARLGAAERTALDTLLSRNIRRIANRTPIIEQRTTPGEINVLVAGWAQRSVRLRDGRRRIVALYVPGDVIEFDAFLISRMDATVAALGAARVAGISRTMLNELSRSQPRVAHGLWWESMVSACIQRQWTINVGHKASRQRLAHLLCELHTRLSLVGLVEDGRCDFPLSQADLADACALTSIHTNRALQEMRGEGLLDVGEGTLVIHDWPALARLGTFDPSYLQVAALMPAPEPDEVALPL